MINFPKTQNLIESLVSERIVPGVNYAFMKGDQVFASTVGFAALYPQKTQLSPFAVYDLASCTKVLATGAVLLKLYEEGRVSFDDRLTKYVPEFGDDRVRLWHLLTHTSGIRGWIPNRSSLSGEDLLKAIVGLPVTDEFESVVRYADTNFVLLGLVVERILGQPVQMAAADMIFRPAGLTETTFHPNRQECVPTVKDLVLMGQAYTGVNPSRLPISQDAIAQLYAVRTPNGLQPRAWGWNLVFDPQDKYPLIYHTGFTGTLIMYDRVKQSGLVMLTNRVHPSRHNQIFLTMRSRIINSFLAENK